MKLLIIASKTDPAEHAVFNALASHGIEVDTICHPDSIMPSVVKTLASPAIRHDFSSRLDLAGVRLIRRQLKSKRYDIVQAFTNRALSCTLLASIGMPLRLAAYRGTMGHLSRFDPASWITYLNPKISKIVSISEAVRRYLISMGIPAGRIVTIHKGQNTAWYKDIQRPALREFGIPPDAFVVGFVGNVRPVKGVDFLIRSAALLPAGSNIHYLLVGEVRDRSIRKLADNPAVKSRVHFAGYRKDAVAITGACNAFAMPSIKREGLCRSLLEAMAQGVAPVISNVGGMPELMINGESGLIVPPMDAQALATAFTKLAADPAGCAAIGRKARERIETIFNVENMTAKYVALYKSMLADEPS